MQLDLTYISKFILTFLCVYLLHQLMIGITAPGGGYYSPFADQYLNYIKGIRNLQLNIAEIISKWFEQPSYRKNEYTLAYVGGRGVALVYGCLGVEVMSIWIIYVILSPVTKKMKLVSIPLGILVILLSNILRIVILLFYANQSRAHVKIDHHLAYNTILYIVVLAMMLGFNYVYQRNNKSF